MVWDPCAAGQPAVLDKRGVRHKLGYRLRQVPALIRFCLRSSTQPDGGSGAGAEADPADSKPGLLGSIRRRFVPSIHTKENRATTNQGNCRCHCGLPACFPGPLLRPHILGERHRRPVSAVVCEANLLLPREQCRPHGTQFVGRRASLDRTHPARSGLAFPFRGRPQSGFAHLRPPLMSKSGRTSSN